MAARDIVLVLMDCATLSWLFGLPFFFFHGVEGISKKKKRHLVLPDEGILLLLVGWVSWFRLIHHFWGAGVVWLRWVG